MKQTVSKYFTGMTPKRGFVKPFKEIDHEIRMLNSTLTHYIIMDSGKKYSAEQIEIRESIRLKKIELTSIAMSDEELYIQERKRVRKALTSDPNYSDLGLISDAIKSFRR